MTAWREPEATADARTSRVRVRIHGGELELGPASALDGLWPFLRRELLTNQQVRERAGGVQRLTLQRWRASHGFPAPVLTFASAAQPLEVWSRLEVDAWLQKRAQKKRARELYRHGVPAE